MCQGCVDQGSLSQATFDRIEAFLAEWPSAEWGPAHIVLSDDNVDDGNLTSCRTLAQAALLHSVEGLSVEGLSVEDLSAEDCAFMEKIGWYADHEPVELRATIEFLDTLLAVPEDER
jgi:hypothetical protein